MTKSITRRQFVKTTSLAGMGVLLGCSVSSRFDIVIKNGIVIDGTGAPGRAADVGIKGDLITAIGNLENASAKSVIDASDKVVCPGFIDIHTHTDTELLVNPLAESKIRQGVTTEVAGNCGSTPFPLNEKDRTSLEENLREKYGLSVPWTDIRGFLEAVRNATPSINYATFTGHGDLRAYVAGKHDVRATPEQLREMQHLLEQSMEYGSLGLSTGLEYAPGSYADTDELIALNEVVAKHNGVYATHMRNEDDTVEEAIQEALTITKSTGVSLQISHLKACNRANWHKVPSMLSMIEKAARDLPVHADRYPYIAYGTGLTAFLPLWSRQGDTEDVLRRLQDNTDIPKIREYANSRGERIGGWDRVVISYCRHSANKQYEGKSIAACAEKNSVPPFEFIRNILIEEENRVSIVGFAMDEENLKSVLKNPLVMVGSDGSAVASYGALGEGKPHPRYYGTFPRVLGKYARDEHLFDLPVAIQKMTSMPAEKLQVKQRGILRENYYADIVIFNPDAIIDRATFTAPHHYPAGISHVLVNGAVTIEKEKHTQAKAGRVI